MKTVWYWWTNRLTDRATEKIAIEISQLIFQKGASAMQWRKDSLFNKWWWNNRLSMCHKTNKKIRKKRKEGREERKEKGKGRGRGRGKERKGKESRHRHHKN